MSDLTDDISEEQLDVIGNLAESGVLGATAYSTRQLVREVRRHRSALAADRERVRSVVEDIVHREFTGKYDNDDIVNADWMEIQRRIATRAAEQLATAGVGLSESDRDVLLRMRKSIQHSGEFTDLLDRLLGASK